MNIATAGNLLIDPQTHAEIPLAMQRMGLSGRLGPNGGVLTVTHHFQCKGIRPMEALYVFQLPRGGALRKFLVKGKDFKIESKLSPRAEAKKTYEEGVDAGHLSTLAETSLDGVVTLAIGQVRPDEVVSVAVEIVGGVETRDQGYRFRFPFTLAPNYHSKANAVATPTGGKLEMPGDVFEDLVLPEWREDASGLHEVTFQMRVETDGKVGTVASPSHNITVQPNDDGTADIWLAGLHDQPDRDLVVDVTTKEPATVVYADESLVKGKPVEAQFKEGPRWKVSIPSSEVPQQQQSPRRVCFVLDRSGSMQGARIDKAKLALQACLSGLQGTDQFGLLAFDSRVTVFHDKMADATDTNRKEADRFLKQIGPGGTTELALALGAAVQTLGGPGGDIFLITDGEVWETGPIIEQAAACGSRIHVLGVGEAAQDRFLASLARRTGGVQRMVNTKEDVATLALELFNAVRTPRLTEVSAVIEMQSGGKTQTHDIGTVWDNRPIEIMDSGISADYLPAKVGLSWGPGENHVVDLAGTYRESPEGELALVWAGQQVEDLEAALDMAKEGPARVAVEQELKELSVGYELASRVMSLCAVLERVGDQAGDTPEQKMVPVGMPSDMVGQGGVFGSPLRSASVNFLSLSGGGGSRGLSLGDTTADAYPASLEPTSYCLSDSLGETRRFTASNSAETFTSGNLGTSIKGTSLGGPRMRLMSDSGPYKSIEPPADTSSASGLIGWLGQLEADGGLPGDNLETRMGKTAVLANLVLQRKIQSHSSAFTRHLLKMADFLDTHKESFPELNRVGWKTSEIIGAIVDVLRAGTELLPSTDVEWDREFATLYQKAALSADEVEDIWTNLSPLC